PRVSPISLHDALPICLEVRHIRGIVMRHIDTGAGFERKAGFGRRILTHEGTEAKLHRLRHFESLRLHKSARPAACAKLVTGHIRSEEHTSELQSRENL